VEHVLVPTSSSLPASRDVVRADLNAFLSAVDVTAPANSDEPLFKIKITEEEEGEGRTILGFSWGHILGAFVSRGPFSVGLSKKLTELTSLPSAPSPLPLPGDGATFNLFTFILSNIYSHLVSSSSTNSPINLSSLSLPKPTTTHIHFKPPTVEAIRDFALSQTDVLSIEEGSRRYTEGALGSKVIVFRLSKQELASLKEKASGGELKVDTSIWISTSDALSAWFAEVLRSCGVEVDNIVNSINVSTHSSFISEKQARCSLSFPSPCVPSTARSLFHPALSSPLLSPSS